jgi:hypothetical protein
MINGTKLLNVVGMTRGRRDGILKSEKQKHVVKIGPMHLKGVWYVHLHPIPPSTLTIHSPRIPYERALEFANKERITSLLYPLFVHNIGALLHHPVNNHPAYRTSSNPYSPPLTSTSASPYTPNTNTPYTQNPGLGQYSPNGSAAPYPAASFSGPSSISSAQIPRSLEYNHSAPPPSQPPMSSADYARQADESTRQRQQGQQGVQGGYPQSQQFQGEQQRAPVYS